MKKLERISSELKELNREEMSIVCGGRNDVTINYCWVVETTEANDSNWNCSDAANTTWQDGVLQGTVIVSEKP